MKIVIVLSCILALTSCRHFFLMSPEQDRPSAIAELHEAKNEQERFYALGGAAKESIELGNKAEAKKYAEELQELIPKFEGDWNYGNAIQDANIVLGRLKLGEANVEEAEKHLLAAGRSPGSPQMDTFGPNMSLAKDLLEHGRKDAVLKYFKLCESFWEMDRGRLEKWADDVRADRIPDFGANLVY